MVGYVISFALGMIVATCCLAWSARHDDDENGGNHDSL